MRITYGSYQCDENATTLQSSQRTNINNGGQPYSVTRRFDVQGYLAGSSQAAIATAQAALKAALDVPYQDLKLLLDSGANSADVLLNQGSISGVKIVEGPSFTDTMGPEYATLRSFRFSAEAEYPLSGTALILLDWQETLTFSGGGPIYTHRPAINGPPQKQLVYPASVFRCQQQGQAVGYLAYPLPSPPKFPSALMQAPEIRRTAPKRKGPGRHEGYTISWSYSFESGSALVGLPTLWV